MSKTIRLDKYLSDMTSETRSKVKEYIRKGRVVYDRLVSLVGSPGVLYAEPWWDVYFN